MRTRTKIILWLLPLFLILLTILYFYLFKGAPSIPWKLVGKPPVGVSALIGFQYDKLYFYTDSGEIYSLFYNLTHGDSIQEPSVWTDEKNVKIDPGLNFKNKVPFNPSPFRPFTTKQLVQFDDPYAIEGTHAVVFALSDDGNIWFWSYSAGVYQGLLNVLILAIEILVYITALVIGLIVFLAKRIYRHSRSPR